MPLYQEMPEEELLAALEHYKQDDILFGEKRKEDAWMRQIGCPRCQGITRPCFSSVKTVFSGDQVMPRHNLACTACGCEFDPRTNVILKLGNIADAISMARSYQTPWVIPGSGEE